MSKTIYPDEKMKPPKDVHKHEHEKTDQKTDQRNVLEQLFNQDETARFQIDGMYCPDCAKSIESTLINEPGIKAVNVSFAGQKGRIDYDPQKADLHSALKKLQVIGYQAHLTSDASERKKIRVQERMLLLLLVAAFLGMQIMMIYLTQLYPLYNRGEYNSQNVRNLQYLVWALATPALFIGGSNFLIGAWHALKAGHVGMNTLVSLGTLSAYGYSVFITLTGGGEVYFDSVAMITTFIMLGRYLEKIGGAQARKDVRHLMQLQPDETLRKNGEDWEKIHVNSLRVGDEIMIKP
ncbi:MAG: cation transporter, partial [Anaerolineales bacterium]